MKDDLPSRPDAEGRPLHTPASGRDGQAPATNN